MPKITVVITAYNLEAVIAKSLDELFSQTIQDFNILVVDDCSLDGTRDIVSQYIERFPERIGGVFLEKNLGKPGLTRNAALDSGKIDGEYVVFLDGDDSIEPIYIETLYNMMLEKDTDIAVCAYDRVEIETGHVLCVEMQRFPKVLVLPPDSGILAYINASVWNKMIRTALIGDKRFSDFSVGEDLCFMLQLYSKCRTIRFTDQVLAHYQVRSSSIISNTQLGDIKAFAEDIKNFYKESPDSAIKDTVELATFIHIGISMAIRANDNPGIFTRQHLSWTRDYFAEHFNLFKGSRFLKFNSLRHHGVRGLAIWFCLMLYKLHSFGLFLFLYGMFKKITRKDVKF